MQPINLFLVVVSTTCLMGFTGCNSNRSRSNPTSSESNQPADSSASPEEAASLASAGVELDFDASTGKLTSADFSGVSITDALASELTRFSNLNKLVLRESAMSLEGWKQLGKLAELQQLDARNCAVDNEQLTAAVSGMPKLRALRLSGENGNTTVDDEGIVALADCPEIKALALDHLWVSADGLKSLQKCPKVSELYLGRTLVDDEGLELLAGFKNLKKLRLSMTSVGPEGMEYLTKIPIEDLDISECSQITDAAMAQVGKMHSLKRLNLWRDVVSDAGLEQLAGLTNLNWLNLDNTHVSDAGLTHLAQMSKLTFLHLGSTSVSDAGMESLSPLKALKDLKITRTGVTESGAAVVEKLIPGVSVQLKYIEGE